MMGCYRREVRRKDEDSLMCSCTVVSTFWLIKTEDKFSFLLLLLLKKKEILYMDKEEKKSVPQKSDIIQWFIYVKVKIGEELLRNSSPANKSCIIIIIIVKLYLRIVNINLLYTTTKFT